MKESIFITIAVGMCLIGIVGRSFAESGVGTGIAVALVAVIVFVPILKLIWED